MTFWESRATKAKRPFVIAHRGASGSAPENTLAAFSEAVAQGADAIELDVRLTKESEIVVFHDATLRRTTNGRGYIRDHTVGELQRFDAGSWFHRSFAGQRIPTLAEVFKLVNGQLGLNIELKPVRGSRAARDLVQRCLRVIEGYRAVDDVLLTSFRHALLPLAKEINPRVTVGVLYHPVHHAGTSPSRLARTVGAVVFVCGLRFLRKQMVADAHRDGIAVAAYTVNTEKHLQRCLDLGIEGIVTNYPGSIAQFLAKKGNF